MDVQLKDGRIVSFPEGTSNAVALEYIEKNFPEEPNVLERAVGHLSTGVAELARKTTNLSDLFGGQLQVRPQEQGAFQDFFADNRFTRANAAYPETSMLGQGLAGLAEFAPQMPLYTMGGGSVLKAAAALPKVGRFVAPLVTKGEGAIANYLRSIPRAGAEGAIVGTVAGSPVGTSVRERLVEGGEEAAGFAAATAVLHPLFGALGMVGRSIFRRMGTKATPEAVMKKLEEKAKTDPAAAEELQRAKEVMATQPEETEELYVPKGEEIAPTKEVQGELPLEPIGEEQMARFKELGYTEADIAGQPDTALEMILDQGIKKPAAPVIKEVEGDSTDKEGLQGRKRRRKEPVEGQPQPGAGEGEAEAGRDVQAHEGEGTPPAYQEKADELGITFNGMQERLNKPSLPTFTDSVTKSTFMVPEGSTVEAELTRMRKNFGLDNFGNLISKDPADILILQRMGYTGAEIKAMSGAEAKATVEAARNVPAPSPEELAKAEAVGAQVAKLAQERDAAKANALAEGRRVIKTPEEQADALEKLEADIENDPEVIAAGNEPLTKTGELLTKLQGDEALGIEDPTLDTLVDIAPKTPEEIRQANADLLRQRIEVLRAKKTEAPKKQLTRKEVDEIKKNARGKARRAGKLDYAKEAEEFERKLAEEGMPEELEFDDTTLYSDPFGFQTLYNWVEKLAASKRTIANAPSNKLIAEINGQKLTMRGDAEHVESVMKSIALNIGKFARSKGMSPDFAYRNNKKVAPLTFDLHKKVYEGNYAASKQNEVARTSESLLSTPEQKARIKDIIEKKITSADPAELEAARLLKGELDATRERYKEHLRGEYKENLNEDENAALAEIIAGRPIDDVIAKYKERVVPDKLGRRRKRKWLDEEVVRDIAKDYQDIDSWGIDDYVTHFERGSLRITSGGKLYAKAMSEKDAARKFADLVELYPDKDFQLDTAINMEQLATGLSKRSYNRMLYNLQEGLRKNIEGINSQAARRLAQKGMKGRFFITPTKQFSPYTMDRKDFLQGEKNIYDIIYHYFYSINRKMALDPAIDKIRKAIGKTEVVGTETYTAKDGTTKTREIKRPYLNKEESEFLQDLVTDVKGRYYTMDKFVDSLLEGTGQHRLYSRVIQNSRELQANLKLGYAPVKGLINGLSGLGHIWSKTGTKYIAEGTQFLRTKEGKEFIKAMEPYLGVNIVEGASGELTSRGTFERLGLLKPPKTDAQRIGHAAIEPLGAFTAPEIPVRQLTVAANYLMAKADGLGEAAARDVAIKANWFQQFTYDMASLPYIMRGPTGRLITQFKPYLLKEMEFISALRGMEIARYMGMQFALAGPRGAVIVLKSLPILGATGAMDRVEEWLNKELPRASRGIGGAVGVDVSAAATFQFPATMRDWLGPTLSDIVAFHKNIVSPLFEGKGIEGSDVSKFMGSTFPIYRYYANMLEQVVDKDGWVKDERGRRLYHIDNTAAFVTKNVMGAEPLELNRIRTEERILSQRSFKISEQKTRTIDNVLDAIGKGRDISPSDLEDMTRLGINAGSLRRAAQFRVLDPKQRRLLMTEVIRRPEVLEMYPEAED